MRNVIPVVSIRLDGYLARPDGTVDFLFMPRDYSMADFLASVDSAIIGRNTFEAGLQMGGTFRGSSMTNYVLSRSQPTSERNRHLPQRTTLKPRPPPARPAWQRHLAHVRRRTGPLLPRSRSHRPHPLGVVPVLLGEGIPLFPGGFPQRDFT